MNQQQLINRVVSAAIWQLMRRTPTWLLIVIVGGAFLIAFAHGAEYPPGLFEHSPELSCDFEHQCYHMDPAHPDKVTPPPLPQYPAPKLAPEPRAEVAPPPQSEVRALCALLYRALFTNPMDAHLARVLCPPPWAQ